MRYLITFSYDGSKFSGYQKQPNALSVQETIEKALTQINSNKEVTIHASGRTDAGVHAYHQKAHFDLDKEIDLSRLRHSLNGMVKPNIFIIDVENVNEDFHARFNVIKKKYTYKINLGTFDPLAYNYVYQLNERLNVGDILSAIKLLEGEHDFTSFAKDADLKESCVRTIFFTELDYNDNYLEITFVGNGFLRYMVRNMVGTLIEIGLGKKEVNSINEILEAKDRTKAGITAPANGLYLMDVYYE